MVGRAGSDGCSERARLASWAFLDATPETADKEVSPVYKSSVAHAKSMNPRSQWAFGGPGGSHILLLLTACVEMGRSDTQTGTRSEGAQPRVTSTAAAGSPAGPPRTARRRPGAGRWRRLRGPPSGGSGE